MSINQVVVSRLYLVCKKTTRPPGHQEVWRPASGPEGTVLVFLYCLDAYRWIEARSKEAQPNYKVKVIQATFNDRIK